MGEGRKRDDRKMKEVGNERKEGSETEKKCRVAWEERREKVTEVEQ